MLILQAERDALLKPLQAVTGIVERRHTLPILSNVLLENVHGQTNILATDLEIQINTAGPESERFRRDRSRKNATGMAHFFRSVIKIRALRSRPARRRTIVSVVERSDASWRIILRTCAIRNPTNGSA